MTTDPAARRKTRGRKSHRAAGWMLVAVVAAGCTSSETVSSSTTPNTTRATSAATTTSLPPVDLDQALRNMLGDGSFSATFRLDAVTTTPAGEIVSVGAGAISGQDSEVWAVNDFSRLMGTSFMAPDQLIGPGGVETVSEAFRVVNGVGFTQRDGGVWAVVADGPVDTSLGHVWERLGTVDEFEVGGSESVQGVELTVMTPVETPSLEPSLLAIDPTSLEHFEAMIDVLVDSGGLPIVVRVEFDYRPAGTGSNHTTMTFRLSDHGSAIPIVAPAEATFSLNTLDFELIENGWDLVDLAIPTSWQITSQETGFITMVTDDLVDVSVHGLVIPEGGTVDDAVDAVIDELDLEPDSVEESSIGIFPSRLLTALDTADGLTMGYVTTHATTLGVLVYWHGPPFGAELQRAHFEELVRTLRWLSGPDTVPEVPGHALGDSLLQSDTLELLLTHLRECQSPRVLWTEPVSGEANTWIEDWYVVCDRVETYTLEFGLSSGQTEIALLGEPRPAGEEDPIDLLADLSVTADRLRSRPWLVETGAGADPVLVAGEVTRARFADSRLYVLVLAGEPATFSEDIACDLLDEVGWGTVLVVSPESVWWCTHGDAHTVEEVEEAWLHAVDGSSDDDVVQRFVSSLLGE